MIPVSLCAKYFGGLLQAPKSSYKLGANEVEEGCWCALS